MKPFACLLLFATLLAITVDSYEVNSKYLSYSPEEEARYQSNLAFLKNFIKEQRYVKSFFVLIVFPRKLQTNQSALEFLFMF